MMRVYVVRLWQPDRGAELDLAPRGFVQDMTSGGTRRFVGIGELLAALALTGQTDADAEGNGAAGTSISSIRER